MRAASRDPPKARCMAEYDIALTNKTRAAMKPAARAFFCLSIVRAS